MRFVIYIDDHEPAHVHVYGDGEAKIDIVELVVLSMRGMTKRNAARAMAIVVENRADLLRKWEEIHG